MGVDLEARSPSAAWASCAANRSGRVQQILDSYDDAVEELGWARRTGIRSLTGPIR